MSKISKFILCNVFGWKITGDFPSLKKYIIIAAPHTHWLDFPLAILVKWTKKQPINFVGKASLFKPPLGFIMRKLGGMPIDRTKSSNTVDSIVEIFKREQQFILALSPEGTRKKVTDWKTGFYYIAKKANVPVVMATMNFKEKEVKISEPYNTTDDKEKDFYFFKNFYKGVVGKVAKYS